MLRMLTWRMSCLQSYFTDTGSLQLRRLCRFEELPGSRSRNPAAQTSLHTCTSGKNRCDAVSGQMDHKYSRNARLGSDLSLCFVMFPLCKIRKRVLTVLLTSLACQTA